MKTNLKLLITFLLVTLCAQAWSEDKTEKYDFSAHRELYDLKSITTVNAHQFTMLFNGNDGLLPAYYSDNTVHLYRDNTFTVTSENTITKIELGFQSDSYSNLVLATDQSGSYKNGVWTGSSKSITFTNESNQSRLVSVTVTYSTSSSSKLPANLSFSSDKATATIGKKFTAPTLSNPNNLDVIFSSSNEKVAVVDGDGTVTLIGIGTTTIKAASQETSEYFADAVTYFLTVKSNSGGALFYESFNQCEGIGGNDGVWDNYIISQSLNTDNEGWSFGYSRGASQCIELGSTSNPGHAVTPKIAIDGNATLTFRAGAWSAEKENTLNLEATDKNVKFSKQSVEMSKGKFTDYTVNITNVDGNVNIKFIGKKNGRFFLDEVAVWPNSVTVGKTGWTTYVTHNAVTFPDNVKAFTVNYDALADQITLYPVTTVPANTTVVLKANAGNYPITIMDSPSTVIENDLTYSSIATEVTSSHSIYVLANLNNVIGFYPMKVGEKVPAYKGYLRINRSSSSKKFYALDNTVTGIDQVRSNIHQVNGIRYNLAGQRVGKDYKGIVIVNGRKMTVK